MTDVKWMIRAHGFISCNCAYGCPCQFNALPTHGLSRRTEIRRDVSLAGRHP